MERQRIKRTWGVAIAGVCLLIPGILLAVCMGAMKILPVDIWNGIFHNTGSLTDMMIRDVRLPRVICVLVTGGILGMTGAMMQGVTRNPIAEPSLLGISQGATLFVALLYASGIGATAGNTLLAALLGAFFSGVPVLIFTMKNPGNLSITKLLLAGTAMSTFFTALTSVAGNHQKNCDKTHPLRMDTKSGCHIISETDHINFRCKEHCCQKSRYPCR